MNRGLYLAAVALVGAVWCIGGCENPYLYTGIQKEQVAALTVSPAGGTVFTDQVEVVLATQTEGARIRYTTDGVTMPGPDSAVYDEPIVLTETTTIIARGYKDELMPTPAVTLKYIREAVGQAAAPTFSPEARGFGDTLEVTLSTATAGATIYYTTDGSTPDADSEEYDSAILLNATTTISAIAMLDGMSDSEVATATYTLNELDDVADPTFDPAGGPFRESVSVALGCATDGAAIRYTLDGSDPNASSAEYAEAIELTATTTIKAAAFKDGMNPSDIVSQTYTRNDIEQAETPEITPVLTDFTDTVEVTMSVETLDTVIRYTLDGSDPGEASTEYAAPITLSATTTIKARAFLEGADPSEVASRTYTKLAIPEYEFVLTWGSRGEGLEPADGEFGIIEDVTLGPDEDEIYVTDALTSRIQVFDPQGTFLRKWGAVGEGPGQFVTAWGIAVDSTSQVYVADGGNKRVQKFSSTGSFLDQWREFGGDPGVFATPTGVDIDSEGNIYVADQGGMIHKFDSQMQFVTQWGGKGAAEGEFDMPGNMAFDSAGNVYVPDRNNHRVQKFSSDGEFLAAWGTEGSAAEQFNEPSAAAVDSEGRVYVVDSKNHRVQVFAASGVYLTSFGTEGDGDGEFDDPESIAIDSDDILYISDSGNARVQKFRVAR